MLREHELRDSLVFALRAELLHDPALIAVHDPPDAPTLLDAACPVGQARRLVRSFTSLY